MCGFWNFQMSEKDRLCCARRQGRGTKRVITPLGTSAIYYCIILYFYGTFQDGFESIMS